MTKVTSTELVVTYGGRALDGHEMDMDQLALSLIALSSTFRRAQQVTTPGADPVRLSVKATPPGSFAVTIAAAIPDAYDRLVDVVTSRHAQAALNASGLVGLVSGALIALKKIGGRRVSEEVPEGSGMVRLILEGGVELVLDEATARLVRDVEFRRSTERTVAPLREDGVETISMHEVETAVTKVTIRESDLPAFEVEDSATVGANETVVDDMMLQPLGVEFDWHQWRVTDGESKFPVTMADEGFRHKVEAERVRFGPSDLLKVRMVVEQTPKSDGSIRIKRTVTDVRAHYPGGEQGSLTFDSGVTPPA